MKQVVRPLTMTFPRAYKTSLMVRVPDRSFSASDYLVELLAFLITNRNGVLNAIRTQSGPHIGDILADVTRLNEGLQLCSQACESLTNLVDNG